MEKLKIAIDCRELSYKKMNSLGLILVDLLDELSKIDMDIYIYTVQNVVYADMKSWKIKKIINYDKLTDNSISLFRYQYWMNKQNRLNNINVFFQINQYCLFKNKQTYIIDTIHDVYIFSGIERQSILNKLKYFLLLKISISNSDQVFTPSYFSKIQIEKVFNTNENKIKVNYNGVSSPINNVDCNSIINEKYLLYIGRLCPWKGTLELIKIFNKEYSEQSNIKLVLAGRLDGSKKYNDEIIREMKLNKNIIYLDYVSNEDREKLLRCCEILIYPSKYDGFGLPPLEAALRNKKCLMNDIPVLREVTHNQGYYFNFYSDNFSLKDSIDIIENDSNSEEKLKKLKKIVLTYTWKNYVDIIVKEIKDYEKYINCG